MSREKKELEIFELCERLKDLLGDKEAIADLKKLYDKHPEMFKDLQDVANTINEVVKEPEIIIKNPRARSEKDYIVSSRLDDEKMGDVGIRNDKGTNVTYHANKKKIEEFYRLQDKIAKNKVQVVGSPTSYTQAQSLDGLVENNISPADTIIAQNQQNQSKFSQEQIKAMQEETKKASQSLGLSKSTKSKDIEL